MIKDSKLIGTKIKEPFGWQQFKVGELFVPTNPERYDLKSSDIIDNNGNTIVISSTSANQGIKGYSSMEPLVKGGKIIYSDAVGPSMMFYQKDDFIADAHVKYLDPIFSRNIDQKIALYLITCIQKSTKGIYDYGNKYNNYAVNNTIIELPITSANQPDFEWMSAYVKAVKADYLEQKALSNQTEIKAYLSAGNVDSTDVTDDDRQFLRDFEKLPRRKFKVGELFDKIGPVSDRGLSDCVVPFDQHLSSSPVNCATAGVNNNGCPMIAPHNLVNPDFILNLGITVSANGANTGSVFVQTNPFVVLQDSYALVFKRSDLSVEDYLFVASLIAKYKCTFNYQTKAVWSRVSDLEIELPVIDSSQVDVESIEKYMKIQIKLTIAKHAKYLDKELASMKTV